MYGYRVKNADVCFYYGKKPCTKTPDTLKMIARALLAAGMVESGADQVTVNHMPYENPSKYVRKKDRHKSADPDNQDHVDTLADMLRRADRI